MNVAFRRFFQLHIIAIRRQPIDPNIRIKKIEFLWNSLDTYEKLKYLDKSYEKCLPLN